MNYLVTGGAGYIGSHMVKYLVEKKHNVTVFDNYSSGKFKKIRGASYKKIDLLDIKKFCSIKTQLCIKRLINVIK